MQIYTKILLGMLVGAVVGAVLGPNSALLDADLYDVPDVAALELRMDPEDPASRLALPAGLDLQLHIEKVVTDVVVDAKGEAFELPVRTKVRFKYSERLSLRDKNGDLRRQLGEVKVGDKVVAWLVVRNTVLVDGGISTWPTPVSSTGTSLLGWVAPVGTLFMRLIKMVIVPLVFASLLVGVASLGDVRKLGRLGGRTLGLYLVTTAVAVTLGLVVAHVVSPGDFVSEGDKVALQAQFQAAAGSKLEQAAAAPGIMDGILAIVPENPMQSLASGDMLAIIFFALLFGVALTLLESRYSEPVVRFFDGVQQAMIVVIHLVMSTAPYGVAALVAQVVGTSSLQVLVALLVYGLTVVIGLALHLFGVYGLLVRLLARLRLREFLRAIRPAQLIAFSTSSSAAALPVTMECAEENLGVSNSVSSFVLPLGATVNMDGTALYQGVAAMFIAQVFQVDLSLSAQLGIVLTATMASIGAAGVPGAGMVTLAMVLTTAGIPTVGVALILGVDRLLDMFRTTVNITGDLAVAAAMAVAEGEQLKVGTRFSERVAEVSRELTHHD